MIENKVPKGYREQDGCYCCKHSFRKIEYESSPCYFCHFDKSKRPLCGSVVMGEGFFSLQRQDICDKLMIDWEIWEEEHFVSPWGVCPNFEYNELNIWIEDE